MATEPSERDVYRQALAAGPDCPPIERLERLLAPDVPRDLAQHLESCSHCQTELEFLRAFLTAPRDEAEAASVRTITQGLESRLPELVRAPLRPPQSEPWWRGLFQVRWLSPAAMAMAGVLIAVAVGVQWQHRGSPEIHAPSPSGPVVMRSGAFDVMAPAGDIREVPQSIQWQLVTGAVQYEARLLEVDRHELWKTTASSPRADLPAPVQAMIVPSKTLLIEVIAFDGSGRKIAATEPAHFRLLQDIYKR